MGVIIKQTIKGTIYTYFGVLIGFITSGFLFPLFFKSEEIGLINILVTYSAIFAQFATLGIHSVTTRLFTYFRNEKNGHNGFLFIAIFTSLIGFLISLTVFYVLKPILLETGSKDSALFTEYFYYSIPLIFFTLFFGTFDNYYKVLYNSVIGTILKELIQRLLILISILIFFFGLIDFQLFVILYIISSSLPTVFILLSLIYNKHFYLKPSFSFIKKDLALSMVSVGFFGIITGFSSLAILRIDSIMIASMIGLSATGVYTTVYFFSTLILLPSRQLQKISSTVLADAWKENNLENIKDVYYKSCINQFIIAALFFIGLWGNIDNIFRILPSEFIIGKYVLFYLALANVIDMVTGVNGTVISNSPYYRFHTYIMIVLIFLIIITNYIFIPILGITGAALASALSTLIFNIARYLFLYFKFKMQPFNYKFILVILISIISYFSVYFIPLFDNLIIDIFIRSSIMTIIFSLLTIKSKVSDEINEKVISFSKTLKF
ncbi:MAG: hypothetical protein A2033_06130 [Bacteroidetes bacterium GWA2_31_9]|nr:MAG: hypothetical protein A2033_06130 [Bacteroidetes bacterium GWA2_31_9]